MFATLLVCAGCSIGAKEQRSQAMVVTSFEDAKFVPIAPGRPGSPEIAVLWGDLRTGPSAMFIRLRKGPVPMHTHSFDYHLVVLKGIVKHWSADETEEDVEPLGPGSSWLQPGNVAHADSCLTDEMCRASRLVWKARWQARGATAEVNFTLKYSQFGPTEKGFHLLL